MAKSRNKNKLKAKEFIEAILPIPRPRQFLVLQEGFPKNSGRLLPFSSLKALKDFLKTRSSLSESFTILELFYSEESNEPQYTTLELKDLK